MNEYSTKIYNQIIEIFPDLECQNKQNTDLLEFHIENEYKANLGDITIQTSENEDEVFNHSDINSDDDDNIRINKLDNN